MNEKVIFLIT